jgi:hypothetical protein
MKRRKQFSNKYFEVARQSFTQTKKGMLKEDLLNNGPPKQAEKAIWGKPILAIVIFETRSPRLLPIANTVSPRIASLTPKIKPTACRIPTTSLAITKIQVIATKNPTNANAS